MTQLCNASHRSLNADVVDSQFQFRSPRTIYTLGTLCKRSDSKAAAPALTDGER